MLTHLSPSNFSFIHEARLLYQISNELPEAKSEAQEAKKDNKEVKEVKDEKDLKSAAKDRVDAKTTTKIVVPPGTPSKDIKSILNSDFGPIKQIQVVVGAPGPAGSTGNSGSFEGKPAPTEKVPEQKPDEKPLEKKPETPEKPSEKKPEFPLPPFQQIQSGPTMNPGYGGKLNEQIQVIVPGSLGGPGGASGKKPAV